MDSNQKSLYLTEEEELMELDNNNFQNVQESDDESDEETEKLVFDHQNVQDIWNEKRNDDEKEIDEEFNDEDDNIYECGVCSSHFNFDNSKLHNPKSKGISVDDSYIRRR